MNYADLFRVKHAGEEYADLLEEAGVDTVPDLAQRDAANLYGKLKEVNAAKDLVRCLPSQTEAESWNSAAKELPRVITY